MLIMNRYTNFYYVWPFINEMLRSVPVLMTASAENAQIAGSVESSFYS